MVPICRRQIDNEGEVTPIQPIQVLGIGRPDVTPPQGELDPRYYKPYENSGWMNLFWILLMPVTVPLLLLSAGLSFPIIAVQRHLWRRRERQFLAELQARGRRLDRAGFRERWEKNEGTTIVEMITPFKGPSRLWWTPEDVRANHPVPPRKDEIEEFCILDEAYCRLCFDCFLDPQSGTALLVGSSESPRTFPLSYEEWRDKQEEHKLTVANWPRLEKRLRKGVRIV